MKENMMIKFINDELEISSEVSHEKKLWECFENCWFNGC